MKRKAAGRRGVGKSATAPPAATRARSTAKRTTLTIEGKEVTLPPVSRSERERCLRLIAALDAAYPDAHCELDFHAPHELLVATILSAQATDVSVNKATPALFARFPTPADYARSTPAEIEPFIRTIGLFRNKAKAIHAAMSAIVERHGGQVPRTMRDLLELRGVARKTANVVLSNAFGTHLGVVVDTHVERLARRFGLVEPGENVAGIERRLMALVPRERWGDISHLLIFHGRRACKARGVSCTDHPICREFGSRCELREPSLTRRFPATAPRAAPPHPRKASRRRSGSG